MLPDYPDLKREMDEILTRFLQERARFHEGVVAEIPEHQIHEGEESTIIRPDGSEDPTNMVEFRHTMELGWREMAQLSLLDVLTHLDKVAKELAAQKSYHFFETLNRVTEKTGNVIDGKGQPFSPETVLQALEKVQIEFDPSGRMKDMTFVVSPSQRERVDVVIKEFETDPNLQQKHRQIMEGKKEQWRAREAARILVG